MSVIKLDMLKDGSSASEDESSASAEFTAHYKRSFKRSKMFKKHFTRQVLQKEVIIVSPDSQRSTCIRYSRFHH